MNDIPTYEDHKSLELAFPEMEDWTLPTVLETRSETHGDQTFLQWETTDRTYTYEETNRRVNRIAHGFQTLDVDPGDTVVLMLPNCPHYVFFWFGLNKIGGVEVPVNTAYKKQSLEHIVNLSDADVAVVDPQYLDRFEVVADELEHLEILVLFNPRGELTLDPTWEDRFPDLNLVSFGDFLPENDDNPGVPVNYYDPSAIVPTSGTTGPSKGVTMSCAHQYFFAQECVELVQLTDEDTYMTGNPLFHSNAQILVTYPTLIAGAKLCLFERFSASDWVDRLQQTGATVCNFLGSMMDFVHKQEPREDDDENDLRCLFAAPTAFRIKEEFEERFGIEYTTEVFGSSEAGLPILTPYGEERPEGAAGKLVSDWFDVKLVNPETDRSVDPGEMGELLVQPREPWITTLGYYNMPEKTVEAYRNCWFHSGDGLRVDEDGWFYFVDRISDTLRRRGENISTSEVEAPILQLEAVEECAVVGVPAEEAGGEEEVKAFVVLKPGATVSPGEIIKHCNENLPYFQVPRYLEFIDELPRTSNEKIKKKDLVERGNGDRTWDREEAGVEVTRD